MNKTLFLDIETFPIVAAVWSNFKAYALETIRPSIMCCYSAKWANGKHITEALPDFPKYKAGKETDFYLVSKLWKLFNEADVIVAHHGDKFDIKVCNARFVAHGLPPPSPYKTVDTRKVSARVFRFGANSLNHLTEQLGMGSKLQTGGYELWRGCMDGDPSSWATMKAYNHHDVVLFETLYNRILPWINSNPRPVGKVQLQCLIQSNSK